MELQLQTSLTHCRIFFAVQMLVITAWEDITTQAKPGNNGIFPQNISIKSQ